jgi:nitronate monooxygenase
VTGWHGREQELAEPSTLAREGPRYWNAVRDGEVERTGVFVGEAIGLIHNVRPAGEIVEQIAAEAEALLGAAHRYVAS